MVSPSNINTFILAGGLSSRMGQEKGLLEWKESTFIETIIKVTSSLGSTVHIISNSNKYNHLECPVYSDIIKGSGPLAGICTGLHHSNTEYNLFLSCDTPCIETNLLQHLVDNCDGYDVTCPQLDNKLHPLIGVYSKRCLENFKGRIEENKLGVIDAVRQTKLNELQLNLSHFPNAETQMSNINTEEDLAELYGN